MSAHEVGHHVQHLLGYDERVRSARRAQQGAEQRQRWLQRGYSGGQPSACGTFTAARL